MVFCEVKFDGNRDGVYYSGQTLSGVIQITNEKLKKIKAATIRIEGYAKCKWTETEGSGRHRRTIHYSGREDYLNSVTHLPGNCEIGKETSVSPITLHRFSCALPFNLPTSFESKYGHIRYQVKVELERQWKIDLKYNFGFTVIKVHDLNYDYPTIRTPLKVETTKNFFLGLSSKSVYISTEIPARGFLAGQNVPITITTNNESNVDVKELKVSLKKIIQYSSQTPRTKTRERIESSSELRHSGVPRKSQEITVVDLILPAVPPTNTTSCSIIQVSYLIEIVAKVGGMHFSPVLRLPVTIGTVPLQSHHPFQIIPSNYNPNEGASTSFAHVPVPILRPAPTVPTAPTAPNTSHATFSQDLPPPSYQEAMGMTSNEADTDEGLTEEKHFSPLYPVMSFGTAPTYFNNSFDNNASPPSYGFSNYHHVNAGEKTL